MRVLYVASDQSVPGRTGGSVHVLEVARGLARLGHEVHAVVAHQPGQVALEIEPGGLTWHRIDWWPRHRFFRFRALPTVRALIEGMRPQVVIERYYNFGGEGIRAAAARGIPALIEVNSPVVDHPGSFKAWLDAALLVRPLRRYREELCARAAALVSPLREIVPERFRAKTEIVTWGANVEAFHPSRREAAWRTEIGAPAGAVLVLFSGSFRPWHGVHVFLEAARRLDSRDDIFFVTAGGRARGMAADFRGVHLGSLPYADMPRVVASCDIGVAPYDTARLAQLRLGFYWSPLKIFEYMASGLPTLTIPRAPLTEIVREGLDGCFFAEQDAAALADAIAALAADPERRQRLGASARERVVRHYSWQRHCEQLDAVLRRIAA